MTKVCIDCSRQSRKQVCCTPRKSLQSIQLSVDSPKSMANSNLVLESKITETVKTILTPGKENKISLRRSKRTALADVVTNTVVTNKTPSHLPMVKNQKPSTKSIQKPKKGRSTAVKKIDQNSNQSKLSFLPIPSTSICTEDLKSKGPLDLPAEVQACLSTTGNNITVFSDPSESNFLTDVEPSFEYWRQLAEERRTALEKALHENELLQDQLCVLEAENNQLKSLVKDAEQLASVLKGVLE